MSHISIVRAGGLALLLGLGACNGVTSGKSAKVAEEVKATVSQMVTHFNARDAVKAVSYDAPDFIGMFHGTPNALGVDGDLATTKRQLADPNANLAVSHDSVEVAASGDMAVYRATYVYRFTDPKTKQATSESGNWVVGFHEQPDGSMKMAWSIAADVPPPPSGPTS